LLAVRGTGDDHHWGYLQETTISLMKTNLSANAYMNGYYIQMLAFNFVYNFAGYCADS
jgi:hypothetical protein